MSYLIHFNPNHDPKNGQFTFSKDTPKIKAYDGVRDRLRQQKEKKKEYISEGYKKSYARRYARDTSNIKIGLSKQYNKYVKDNIRFNKKSEKYAEKGKEEKAELWAKRAVLAYKDAKLTEAYIDQAAELGRAFCTTLATEFAKGYLVGNITSSRPVQYVYV